MYKLYWDTESASLAAMAVLEEIGVAYEAVQVNLGAGEHKTGEYLAINPCGLVPALVLPDGRAIFEGAAIVMHLCDAHAALHLAPPPGDPDRPLFYQWMLYLADTPQSDFRRYYHADRFAGDEEDVRKRGVDALLDAFRIVDDALAHGEWLLGERFSACDIYLHMLTTWFDPPEALYRRYAGVAHVAKAVEARPACARAIERHRA